MASLVVPVSLFTNSRVHSTDLLELQAADLRNHYSRTPLHIAACIILLVPYDTR